LSSSLLTVTNVKKSFAKNEVLKGISLEARKGEIVVILGPSGSGKSTLLRCINFLEMPDEGIIEINGLIIDAKKKNNRNDILRLTRQTAMVFQNYNLFKNKTVFENIVYPLTIVKKIPKAQAAEIARINLAKVGLFDKDNEYPSFLSGGQAQRVGIARALALNPGIILFDEPTSSLDPELVKEVLASMRTVAEEGITMIVVTHEMSFAYDIATKVIFIDQGLIVEQGPPREVFERPKEERTKQFLDSITKDRAYSI
jgi:L-cystine transport system ATP-binding protein